MLGRLRTTAHEKPHCSRIPFLQFPGEGNTCASGDSFGVQNSGLQELPTVPHWAEQPATSTQALLCGQGTSFLFLFSTLSLLLFFSDSQCLAEFTSHLSLGFAELLNICVCVSCQEFPITIASEVFPALGTLPPQGTLMTRCWVQVLPCCLAPELGCQQFLQLWWPCLI